MPAQSSREVQLSISHLSMTRKPHSTREAVPVHTQCNSAEAVYRECRMTVTNCHMRSEMRHHRLGHTLMICIDYCVREQRVYLWLLMTTTD